MATNPTPEQIEINRAFKRVRDDIKARVPSFPNSVGLSLFDGSENRAITPVGFYTYNPSSNATPNGISIVDATPGKGLGRWIIDSFSRWSIKDFGVVMGQTTAAAAAVNTKALQSALDSGERLYGLPGILLLDQPLQINNAASLLASNMTLKLSDAMTFDTKGYRFFYANAIQDIELAGLVFDGNKANISKHAINNTAVWLQDCVNATIRDCVATNLQGAGSNLNTAFGFVNQTDGALALNTTVRDSIGGAVFMQGPRSLQSGNRAYNLQDIAFVFNAASCYDSTMYGNRAVNCQGGGIGIENGPYSISVVGNNIGDTQNGYGIAVLAIGSTIKSYDITVSANTIRGNGGTNPCNGIAMVNCYDYVVSSNIVRGINRANANNSGIACTGSNYQVAANKIHVDAYGIACSGSDFDISNNQVYSTNQIGIFFNNTSTDVLAANNRVKAGTCFQKNGTFSGQLLDNVTMPFGSNPIRYLMGNVGYGTSIQIRDAALFGFCSADGPTLQGRWTGSKIITAGASDIVTIDFTGKPWEPSISWGQATSNIAGVIVNFDGWVNAGQTAIFRLTNSVSSSVTVTALYYTLFGQRTQAATA